MNGMALGFYEETTNGHRIIGHAGDTQYLHSGPASDSGRSCRPLPLLQQCWQERNQGSRSSTACLSGPLLPVSTSACQCSGRGKGCTAGFGQIHHQPSLGNYHPQSADSLGESKVFTNADATI